MERASGVGLTCREMCVKGDDGGVVVDAKEMERGEAPPLHRLSFLLLAIVSKHLTRNSLMARYFFSLLFLQCTKILTR